MTDMLLSVEYGVIEFEYCVFQSKGFEFSAIIRLLYVSRADISAYDIFIQFFGTSILFHHICLKGMFSSCVVLLKSDHAMSFKR
jgi:hypothetical protein